MFAIGEFARYGRVTIRVLRHYDAIGLLGPVCVDPATGYRIYEAGQLSRLNRIVALKSLGFTLQQVATILDEQYQAHRGTAGRRTDQHSGRLRAAVHHAGHPAAVSRTCVPAVQGTRRDY